jgi:ubiquinone/menaquinone biosynthesis C-methylase UbiE
MTSPSGSCPAPPALAAQQLLDTQRAFDSVAADYDGPRGNNPLIQDMRLEMWRALDAVFPKSGRLIDLGCGTGLDAVRMAQLGHHVTATDWSASMVERTRERAAQQEVPVAVEARAIGAHELHRLEGDRKFDGAYSNLGALNCVPEMSVVARECARLLTPGGRLVFTVIGRICPWEIAYYLSQGRWARVKVRYARAVVPVGMNNHTIWTRYYQPREFYRAFREHFTLEHYRGLCVLAPPPYLTWMRERHARVYDALRHIDRQVSGWPLLRAMGDHFLIVMKKR